MGRNDKAKVLHLVESLSSGGLERVVVDLATAQVNAGTGTRVACLFHRGQLANEAEAAGVEVFNLEKSDGFDLDTVKYLRRILRELEITVLHTHNQMAHYYGVAASIGLRIVIVNTRHGMGAFRRVNRRELFYRLALPFTDAVVSVCQANRDLMRRKLMFGARHSILQRNGIRLEHMKRRSGPCRSHARAELGLRENQICFATVGRLDLLKNQALMIQAYAALPAGNHCLVMVGDGAEKLALQDLIKEHHIQDRVRMLGLRSDVPEILCAFDVFVLSSISEGYSLALLEAASAELPIIATDVGGNTEIVTDQQTGLITPSRDVAAMTTAMARFIAEPELIDQYGKAGRQWALDHASLKAMVSGYDAIYRGESL